MKGGFTLIETVLSLGLTMVLLTGLAAGAFGALSLGAKSEQDGSVKEEGDFLIKRINLLYATEKNPALFASSSSLYAEDSSGSAFRLSDLGFAVSNLSVISQNDSLEVPFIGIRFLIDSQEFSLKVYQSL